MCWRRRAILLVAPSCFDEERKVTKKSERGSIKLVARILYLTIRYANLHAILDPMEDTSIPGINKVPADDRKVELADRSIDVANM